jgi:Tol biopolymer transport system component
MVAIALLAGFAAALFMARGPAPHTLRVSVLAPEGVEVSAEVPDIVISPDGTTIAFVGQDSSGVSHLWVRPLSAIAPRLLPGTEDAKLPFWAPNSRELGFFAGGNLRRIAVDGESAQTLTAAPNPRGAAWSPRGVIVFAPTASGPLVQVPATGGDARPATVLDPAEGESAHRFPCFLPDGRHFLYVSLPGRDQILATRVGSLDGGAAPVVLRSRSGAIWAAGYVVYNREGTIVAQPFDPRRRRTTGHASAIRDLKDVTGSYSGSPMVTASMNGILLQREPLNADVKVQVLDRTGRPLSTIPLPAASYSLPRLSPDGRQLVLCAFKASESSAPLWMVDMTRGTSARFTSTGHFDTAPAWSRDGRFVYYGSDRTGGRELWRRRADGSMPEELVAHVPNLFNDPGDMSLDGRVLAYRSLSGTTGEDIWMLPLEGERKPRPLLTAPNDELDPALSPDGRWIAYRSDGSGRFEVHAKSFPALDRTMQVSTTGASPTANRSMSRVCWRGDGRELYFVASDALTLMAASVDPGADLQFGIPHALFRLPPGTASVEVASDGQRVIACLPAGVRGRTVLNLLMNWEPELRAAK